jgi:hypothetical protein
MLLAKKDAEQPRLRHQSLFIIGASSMGLSNLQKPGSTPRN